jgi:hypothetical protein
VLLAGGCGPTSVEIGTSGMIAGPIAYIGAVFGGWAMLSLWRWTAVSLRPQLARMFGVLAVFVVLALLASQIGDIDGELSPVAYLFPGLAGFALTAIVGRMLVNRGEQALTVAPIGVTVFMLIPFAIAMLAPEPIGDPSSAVAILIALGHLYVTPIVLLGLLIEGLVRRKKSQSVL